MRHALLLAGLLLSLTTSIADQRCSATSEAGTRACTVLCPAGYVATCEKEHGSEAPSCRCELSPVANPAPAAGQSQSPPPGPTPTPK